MLKFFNNWGFLLGVLVVSQQARAEIPTFDEVKKTYLSSEGQLLDRKGVVLQDLRLHPEFRRLSWLGLDEVAQPLKQMVVEAEDKRFFEHSGVDFRALLRGALSPFSKHPRGASTLSMQMVAMLNDDLKRGSRPRNLTQKWEQMQAAWDLEKSWSKKQIFEAYLNFVSFRGELQGVGAASFGIFGKTADSLDVAESAILASLIRSPNSHIEKVKSRACAQFRVYQKSQPIIDECPRVSEMAFRVLSSAHSSKGLSLIRREAPELARMLVKKGDSLARIKSTVDFELQTEIRAMLSDTVRQWKDQNVHDAAALVVDHKTNEILAYVGNTGDKYVDGIQAKRQAGSTLKPLLYGMAIEKRYLTQSSLLDDSPVEIPVSGGLYRPLNYDKTFHGIVPLRKALASSLNVPAVKTLMLVGVSDFRDFLEKAGVKDLEEADFYGPSLALGSVDVSLFELVGAYAMLARGGEQKSFKASLQAVAPWEKDVVSRRLMSQESAFVVSEILSSNENREIGFGSSSPLDFKYWVAAKTGTSKDMRDNWCLGFSERYTVGVWMGNFNGDSMWNVTGMTGAAPVFSKIMNRLHRNSSSKAPRLPKKIIQTEVADVVGSEVKTQLSFVKGTEPQSHSQMKVLDSASENPKILYPIQDMMVAIDPDIPQDRQKIVFEANRAALDLNWEVDGVLLNTDKMGRPLWPLKVGSHRVALVNKAGKALSQVSFVVRGSESLPGDQELSDSDDTVSE